jgi:hypothetical protein
MIQIPLCPHKMNVNSCPTCFRNKPVAVAKPKEAPGIKPGIAVGYVMPIGEATMRATQRAAAIAATPVASGGKAFREPYRSSTGVPPPEAYDHNKVWKPKEREELIDRLPTHPHANEGKAQVLKA